MSEQQKQELLAATQRMLERARTESRDDSVASLKRIGILDEDGILSERYGGPGKMTWPANDTR